jgi:hypothetical protein
MSLLKKSLFLLVLSPCLVLSQSFYLGESNEGSGSGNLYSIDAATCTLSTIGAMGRGVTGLATDANGNLFATEATLYNNVRDSNLLSINTSTGVATDIGLLDDGSLIHGAVPDISFRGATLYGWTEETDTIVTIDTLTGAVTDLGNGNSSSSTGLAANSSGTLIASPDNSNLYTVDPVTGVNTQLIALVNNTTGGLDLNALTFDNADNLWGYAGTTNVVAGELVTVNLATGSIDTVCTGLPFGIDSLAIAGPALPPAVIPASTNWFIAAIIMLFIGFGGIFGYKRFG